MAGSPARRARWCAPASTRPRAPSRSTSEQQSSTERERMATHTENGTASSNGKVLPGEPENPLHRLSEEQIEAIGREFDELHDEVFDDLGERDARYIRSIIDLHRRLALLGRVLLVGSRFWPVWLLGTSTLSLAKILENMEIGHNV